MFSCTCCDTPREYSARKALYHHIRKSNPDFVAPVHVLAEKRRNAYEVEPKLCESCDHPLTYEQAIADGGRKYCSRSCAATVNGRLYPKRGDGTKTRPRTPRVRTFCEICSEPTSSRWGNRFCSTACHRVSKYDHYIAEWKAGERSGGTDTSGISPTIRRYIFEKYDNKCSCCGWNEVNPHTGKIPLQVDHINGNPNDHREENLRLICPNCHSLTSTFGALNKGSGRAYRRKRYADGKSF